jgi:hypothetical protein
MSRAIVYQVVGRPLSAFHPAEDKDLERVGPSIVPQGIPFWIVEASTIPADRTFRNAWDLEEESLGVPSGYGEAEQ